MAEASFTFGKTAMLFPTPVLSYRIADAERLNLELLEEIAQRRANDPGVVRSNRAGWHSQPDFFDRREPAHAQVAKAISQAVADSIRRVRSPSAQEPFGVQINGWINVNPPSAYNVPHDHPGSFWSGCYYIKTQGVRHERDESGAITFLDSRCAPAGQPLVRASIFSGAHTVQPTAGTLLVFPSTVKHWVHPNESDGERVSMAFNVFIIAKRKQSPVPLPDPTG